MKDMMSCEGGENDGSYCGDWGSDSHRLGGRGRDCGGVNVGDGVRPWGTMAFTA